jgi:hypothetical protein
MYVGNILTTYRIEDENFKICRKLETIDESLPTLIIGWSKTKELYGDKASILHKQISDNVFWTFTKEERKVEYEHDIEDFKNLCYNNVGKDIPYVYLDVIHDNYRKNRKILRKIFSLSKSTSFITEKNMLYIYGENIIFGIDLNLIEYIGITKEKVINRLNKLPNNFLIENEIFNKCKDFILKLKNSDRLTPYIIEYGKYRQDNNVSIIRSE